ncbi:MAG: glycosyltransferase [Methylococcales bacterium]
MMSSSREAIKNFRPGQGQSKRTVLFFRDFRRFHGGHLKVWHYYQHLKHSENFRPAVYFSEGSLWTEENPWLAERDNIEPGWEPGNADILFLGGNDWRMLDQTGDWNRSMPIVNLIQHVSHGVPTDSRFLYLSRKAIRICVSEQVSECLRATKRVQGPIFTITNGLDPDEMPPPQPHSARDIGVFVAGLKNPQIAGKISEALRGHGLPVEMQSAALPRRVFLTMLNRSKMVVLLPSKTEGFYLPALEAMALGTLTICPDCVGNRAFCVHNINCIMPDYGVVELVKAALTGWSMDQTESHRIVAAGRETAFEHGLISERIKFLEIMNNIDRIWQSE